MEKIKLLFMLFTVYLSITNASRVLELTDKFADIRREGDNWLVMFYAPWCGHCKRLEPIWGHVAQSLYRTNIRVGRVDCTRFTSLATEFSIQGFPTIKFIKNDEEHNFHGDRTKDDIINFALRMSGPPVQQITKSETMDNLKAHNALFFMYVGPQEGLLWQTYNTVAEKFQPHGFFYSVPNEIAKKHVDIDDLPAVFVYKESCHYFFPLESGDTNQDADQLNATMHDWINEERFQTFPKVTRGNINQIMQTKKFLVLAIVEENKLAEIPTEMIEFRDMVESIIRKKRDTYHKTFQFGWVGTPELANSIAMTVLPLPYLLVLNSTTNHHHIPEDEPTQLTSDSIDIFLQQIYNQSAPVYGGNALPVRLYRMYFEARTSLGDMWQGNPVLTMVLFGLPMGFLSLILYSICCADILDADEEEEPTHEKKE